MTFTILEMKFVGGCSWSWWQSTASAYASATGYGRRLMGQLWANGLLREMIGNVPKMIRRLPIDEGNDNVLLWSGLLGATR